MMGGAIRCMWGGKIKREVFVEVGLTHTKLFHFEEVQHKHKSLRHKGYFHITQQSIDGRQRRPGELPAELFQHLITLKGIPVVGN